MCIYKKMIFVLLLIFQPLFAGCYIDVAPVEISFFHEKKAEDRLDNVAKISGDGSKIVYVEDETGFDLSLSGWLSGRESAWTDENKAKVYLYDSYSGASTLIYEGAFSYGSSDGVNKLNSLESGFSVDINYDGSAIIVAYTSTSFNSKRDNLTNSLNIAHINTSSLTKTDITSFTLPSFGTQKVPMKLSADGSRIVFIYSPALDETSSTWGVEYKKSSDTSKLVALPVAVNASSVVLSQDSGEHNTQSELLKYFSDEYMMSFDISDDGQKIIFGYPNSGEIIGVNSDGSNYHTIATVTAERPINVTISGDGNTVAYTDRASNDTVIYKNNFSGSSQSIVLNKDTFASGNLFLNSDGSSLLFSNSVAGPGGTYGYSASSYFVSTDGEMLVSDVKKDLYDVTDNFVLALSSYYDSAALDVSLLTSGSTFNTSTNEVYLSSLYIYGDSDSVFEVYFQTVNFSPLQIQLSNANVTPWKANLNAVYYPNDELRIPYISVGDECYKVDMKLVDTQNYTFELQSATKLD